MASARPVARQPYRIILIGEKSSLGEVLEPIARQVKGELLLPTGEMSDTMIAEMAARAAADPRPAVVLYFSDFDPSGWQMPISSSRKLQALRTLRHPELGIAVHRVALTLDQVRGLNLPSTPLKETEKRASKWRERMGHEQTEIDALAALRPEELTRIALDALKPFFDFTLDERCGRAATNSSIAAHRKLAAHPALPALSETIRTAHQEVEVAIKALEDAQCRSAVALAGGRRRDQGRARRGARGDDRRDAARAAVHDRRRLRDRDAEADRAQGARSRRGRGCTLSVAETIAIALGGACRSGAWQRCHARCINRGARHWRSRMVRRGLIVHCHAGCSRDDVLAELRRLGLLGG